MYDLLSGTCMLLSCFLQPEFLRKLEAGNLENYLSTDKMFIGIPRNSIQLLFYDGDTNQEQCNKFLSACFSSYNTSFLYASKCFPMDNSVLKHVYILKVHNQTCCLESVPWLIENLSSSSKFLKKIGATWEGNSVH